MSAPDSLNRPRTVVTPTTGVPSARTYLLGLPLPLVAISSCLLVVVNSPDDRVRLPVMQYAQPNHIKRLRVVWVVRLRLLTTNPTRLRHERPGSDGPGYHVGGRLPVRGCGRRRLECCDGCLLSTRPIAIPSLVVGAVILGPRCPRGSNIEPRASFALSQQPVAHRWMPIELGARLGDPALEACF